MSSKTTPSKRGMYWYKPWCELRTVALIGVGALAVACLFIVLNQQTMRDHADHPMTYVHYVWKSVYDSFGRDLFVVLTIVLGCGGLRQEKAQGTSGFTLTLPVSRRHIVFSRAMVGSLGVAAIAFTPALLLPLVSRYVGQAFPVGEALRFGLLWWCAGTVFYAYTYLLAHLLEGEYTAMLVALPSLTIYGFAITAPVLDKLPLNLFSLLNGEDTAWFSEGPAMFAGPLPWVKLAMVLLVAATLVWLAARHHRPAAPRPRR